MKSFLPPSFFLGDHDEEAECEEPVEHTEDTTQSARFSPRFRRGIYLLPNSLTIAGLFAGFYAIVAAMKGHFESATVSVFVAMLMDFLDGRVARLTHTQSAFGTQLDSLSDMVSFGVTPGLVMYTWSLYHFGKLGWLSAFLFTAAGALRLARFNIRTQVVDKCYFQGLPIPAAAGILMSFVWASVDSGWEGSALVIAAACLTVLTGLLMVSNLKYPSFKEIDLKGRVPFVSVVTVLLVLIAIALDPPKLLFLVFFFYSLSGFWVTLRTIRKARIKPIKPS
jgi:CDP-diacylglycerol---serine O-phosphatidyltransferase